MRQLNRTPGELNRAPVGSRKMEEVGHVIEITEAETKNSQKDVKQLNMFNEIDPENHANQNATSEDVESSQALQRLAVAVRCLAVAARCLRDVAWSSKVNHVAWSSKARMTTSHGFSIWFVVYVNLETKTKTGLNISRSTSTQSPSLCETWSS